MAPGNETCGVDAALGNEEFRGTSDDANLERFWGAAADARK
ncbi:hypothetical protein [Chondromyces crocatus]|nr:hypothetical protein [Chondromyces crocatus]